MQTRLSPRVNIVIKITLKIDRNLDQHIRLSAGDSFRASTCDMSKTGLSFIVKRYYLPRGLFIELYLDNPFLGQTKSIKIKGEICYCNYIKRRAYKCGVKFIEMSTKHKKLITQFMTSYHRLPKKGTRKKVIKLKKRKPISGRKAAKKKEETFLS